MELQGIQRKGCEKFVESSIEKEINPTLGNKLKHTAYFCLSFLTLSGIYAFDIKRDNNVGELQRIEENATRSLLEKGYSLEQITGKRL